MRFWIIPLLGALLIPSRAQTLAARKVNGAYVIEASATAETPGTLQVSHNMRLWVDVLQNIQEPVSTPVDNAGEAERYYRLVPAADPAAPIVVMIIGDSMSADCCGWGVALPNYFKENATVVNYAQAWQTTKVFLNSSLEMQRMMQIQPNYVFIYFAWSDAGPDPNTNAQPDQFRANLLTIGRAIQGFNGVPIYMPLHAYREFDEQGLLHPWEHHYNFIIREVATELNAPMIDMYKISRKVFEGFGPQGVEFFHWTPGGPDDRMHFSPLGAEYMCRMLLRDAPLSLAPYLKRIFDAPPPIP